MSYRCYFRDESGYITALQTIRCDADEEAKRMAWELFSLKPHYAIELWTFGRPVLRLTRASEHAG
jgi:hypothetical protein